MDALFIIPALVSPNVSPKLVPALAKSIERNTIISYYASIRTAVLRKYGGRLKTAMSESDNISSDDISLLEMPSPKKKSDKPIKILGDVQSMSKELGLTADTGGREFKTLDKKATLADKASVEYPSGITFYNTIGLEPTYLQIPISVKTLLVGSNVTEKIIVVGFKCVPYEMTGVKDVITLANDMRGRNEIKKLWNKKSKGFLSKLKFRFPRRKKSSGISEKEWAANLSKFDPRRDIIFSPNSEDLANPATLKKLLSPRKSSKWSTLTIFSTYDFGKDNLKQTLMDYKSLSKAGWGDMIVVNDAQESAYFCTSKMAACYNLPFSYMRNVMNLDDVLDYSEVSKWGKPFSMTSIRRAIQEGDDMNGYDSTELIHEIETIIRPGDGEEVPTDEEALMRGTSDALVDPLNRGNINSINTKINDIIQDVDKSPVVKDLGGESPDTFTDPFDGHTNTWTGKDNIMTGGD